MKNTFKLLITLLLVFSLVFTATACETLEELGIDVESILASEKEQNQPDQPSATDPEGNSGNGNSGGNEGNQGGNESGGESGNGEPYFDADFDGGVIYLPNKADPVTSDPYVNVDVSEFYANYTPAISYMDAYYRTQHNLMSGTIGEQDQAPTISEYQPIIDGKFVRNTAYLFSEDGNTYYVVDSYGNIVKEIYRDAAYIMLDEVAAYVFAFGNIPANHTTSKNTSPTSSPWGEFLRLNKSKFTGSTTKYPYEPELPNISGCGGDLYYYEMDVGTTGTDCDPSYSCEIYNNGSRISRGAARIVYTKQDLDFDGVIEIGETYLFYTYNHYNDFQEYLNYDGGWGEKFGNITGGGTISSKTDYNPTPYVEVAFASFVNSDGSSAVKYAVVVVMWMPGREEV